MSSGENKLMKRRLAGAWISSVISITLVLFLVGVGSLLLVNAKSVSDYFKENGPDRRCDRHFQQI